MAKRQFRIVTGLTGLLIATGASSLLSDQGDGWVGSAYAQDADSGDDTADAAELDESSAEGADDASDGESVQELASTEGDTGMEEEESEPDDEVAAVDDSEVTASEQDASAEPNAAEPAQPESAPEAAAEAPPAPSPPEVPRPQITSGKDDRVREVLYQHTREILPDLASHEFKGSDSLRSLGANSVDRAEILMLTLETLGLQVPMIELAKVENLDALAELIASKMP